MDWKVLTIDDFEYLTGRLRTKDFFGSDTSLVNLFVLQPKYDIKVAISRDCLFRYYTGAENRTGYGFPIFMNDTSTSSEKLLRDSLELIINDAKENSRGVKFCLLTMAQKELVEKCISENFPFLKFEFFTDRNDSDYIYDRKFLAELSGKTYHKKKNHVSKFLRFYEGRWEFRSLNLCNISDDMIKVSEIWAEEHDAQNNKALVLEKEAIKIALQNKNTFGLEGGVLYTDGVPVGMTLASKLSDDVLDVHYEKCLNEQASNGAYAAINWCFACSMENYKFLNREEDMGVEGLRKAKLSYHPQIILDKYYGEVK